MTNILLYSIDDALSWYHYRDLLGIQFKTPNLDKLCGKATRFDAAYAMVTVCGPSRAQQFTGWSPWRSMILANGDAEWYDIIPSRDNVMSMLRRAGYYVGTAGKVMHGYVPQPGEQRAQMIDEGMGHGVTRPPDNWPGQVLIAADGEDGSFYSVPGADEMFYDWRVATWGIDFINRQEVGGKPWALFLGTQHPHTQYTAPKQFYDAFDVNDIQVPTWFAESSPLAGSFAEKFMKTTVIRPGSPSWPYHVWGYMAAMMHADHHIGRVMDALEASPFADDTIVIVVSDHGWHFGDRDTWAKFTLWEEAARTPMIVKRPGQDSAAICTSAVSLADIMPTILDYAGIEKPSRIDGQSVRNLIGDGGTYENRGAVSGVYGSVSIRRNEYRYILYPDDSEELYDVVGDWKQLHNLAGNNALTQDMRSRLVIEMARYGKVQASKVLPQVQTATQYMLYDGARVTGGPGNDRYQVSGGNDWQILGDSGGHNTLDVAGWKEGGNVITLPDGIQDMYLSLKNSAPSPTVYLNNENNRLITPQKAANAYLMGGDDYAVGRQSARIYGGDGNDTLEGISVGVRLYGDDGDDVIFSRVGSEMFGGEGKDRITWDGGDGYAEGGPGDDTISGGADNDTIYGGAGHDSLSGGNGNDYIHTGVGGSIAYGGGGNDTIVASDGDSIFGGSGVDRFEIGPHGSIEIGDWSVGEKIDVRSWGVVPAVSRITDQSVLVRDGSRGVIVNSSGSITVAQVQAALETI